MAKTCRCNTKIKKISHLELQTKLSQIFETSFTTIESICKNVFVPVFGQNLFKSVYSDCTNACLKLNTNTCKKNKDYISFLHIGTINISERELKVYELVLGDHVHFRHVRLHMQQFLRAFLNVNDCAFVITHYQHPEQKSWRFSYVEKYENQPYAKSLKRHTYIFGPSCAVHMAAHRLAKLSTIQNLKIHDIIDAFSISNVTKSFYQKLFTWYEWAQDEMFHVTFPELTQNLKDGHHNLNEHLIRLIMRLIFVWFLKQKGWIANALFDPQRLKLYLKEFNPMAGMPPKTCDPQREEISNYYHAILHNLFFALLNQTTKNHPCIDEYNDINKTPKQSNINSLYQNQHLLTDIGKNELLKYFQHPPLCSEELLTTPNTHDLNKEYHTITSTQDGLNPNSHNIHHQSESRAFIPNALFFSEDQKNPGIITIFKQYQFTIEESTTEDIYVALDPEVLGNVFENLLASYNPETQKSARAATGSFYTPREVVRYMVDSSLCRHIKNKIQTNHPEIKPKWIDQLFAEDRCPQELQGKEETIQQILWETKILDPACGSGAFPLGSMACFIELLYKLNPSLIDDIYTIKKKIIEQCLYGIDIQPIAVQLTKLRCFISLIAEDDLDQPKTHLKPYQLPKLETHFVAANALIPPDSQQNTQIHPPKHNNTHHLHCNTHYPHDAWPNFDPNEMFQVKHGFEIVIGNPPYGASMNSTEKRIYQHTYPNLSKKYDIYMVFFELGIHLTNDILCYITPDKWLSNNYAEKFRKNICLYHLIQMTHLGANIFDSARVDAIVACFTKNHTPNTSVYRFLTDQSIQYIKDVQLNDLDEPYLLDHLFVQTTTFIHAMDQMKHRLADYCICDYPFADPHAVYALKPYLESCTSDVLPKNAFKVINTGTIRKYGTRWIEKDMTYLKSKYHQPYILNDNLVSLLGPAVAQRLAAPKIICKGLNLMDACIDTEGSYISTAATLNIRCKSHHDARLKVIAAIINSDIVIRYFKEKYISSSWNGALRFNPEMLMNLPLPSLDDLSQWTPLIADVDQILCITDVKQHADQFHIINNRINTFVNNMYQLGNI